MKRNFGLLGLAGGLGVLPAVARAAEEATSAVASGNATAAAYWAAGICMAVGAVGVAYSQGRAASIALEGVARNPVSAKDIFTPLILSLALMEAIGLLAFLVANTLAGK